ncbi:MBL fold metallo-hydrolase, partial [Staphylococcus aureus]
YEYVKNIKNLPDYVQIWPGHGAGSPCGKALGAIHISTIGYEKINNWAFNEIDETKFIESLTSNQPAPPHHFAQMKQVNKFGMNLYKSYDVYLSLDNKRVAF